MPQEFDQARSYHEALRRLGVQNPERVRLGSPVQFTAAVDDLSHLVAPVSVPVVSAGVNTSASALEFSGMEVVAGARTKGIFLELVENRQNATAVSYIGPLTGGTPPGIVRTVLVAARPLLCQSGPPAQSIVNEITLDAIPEAGSPILANQVIAYSFFLGPGQSFFIVRTAININANFSVHWREVPLTGPVEP